MCLPVRDAVPRLFVRLSQHTLNHFPTNIRQPEIAALKTIGQLGVINPQQMQNGGLHVMHMEFSPAGEKPSSSVPPTMLPAFNPPSADIKQYNYPGT